MADLFSCRPRSRCYSYFNIGWDIPFLSVPLFDPSFPLRTLAAVLAIVTAAFWIAAMYRIVTKFDFSRRPSSYTDNLRDIVYLKRRGT